MAGVRSYRQHDEGFESAVNELRYLRRNSAQCVHGQPGGFDNIATAMATWFNDRSSLQSLIIPARPWTSHVPCRMGDGGTSTAQRLAAASVTLLRPRRLRRCSIQASRTASYIDPPSRSRFDAVMSTDGFLDQSAPVGDERGATKSPRQSSASTIRDRAPRHRPAGCHPCQSFRKSASSTMRACGASSTRSPFRHCTTSRTAAGRQGAHAHANASPCTRSFGLPADELFNWHDAVSPITCADGSIGCNLDCSSSGSMTRPTARCRIVRAGWITIPGENLAGPGLPLYGKHRRASSPWLPVQSSGLVQAVAVGVDGEMLDPSRSPSPAQFARR